MKKLTVNVATCDMRNITAEQLAAYDAIQINCAMVLTSPEAQQRMAGYPVMLNAGNVLCLDTDLELVVVNGAHTITEADPGSGWKALIVNGHLEIKPGAAQALSVYKSIIVNGCLLCPASLSEQLRDATVNGTRLVYPDGAIPLRSPVLTQAWVLRASAADYYSPTLAVLDSTLDLTKLKPGVRFLTDKAVVAEGLAEDLLPLLPETAEVILVPDGTAYVERQLFLESYTSKQYGGKLYVDGDLFLRADHLENLDWIEYLAVSGSVTLSEELVAPFTEKATSYGELRIMPQPTGMQLTDKPAVAVDTALLELAPDGIHISDCGLVELSEDLSGKTILEKLKIQDCRRIHCTQAQKSAVSVIAEDYGYLGPADQDTHSADQETLINAAKYTF